VPKQISPETERSSAADQSAAIVIWVVLARLGPKGWERYGLQAWIEAAKSRLHHNVLAIAPANKLARIAWAVLNKGRAFECVKADGMASRPA
jgi:hypothetical protein